MTKLRAGRFLAVWMAVTCGAPWVGADAQTAPVTHIAITDNIVQPSVERLGINLGAFLGTILCGLIGEDYNFHWGFSLARQAKRHIIIRERRIRSLLFRPCQIGPDRAPSARRREIG